MIFEVIGASLGFVILLTLASKTMDLAIYGGGILLIAWMLKKIFIG